MRLTVRESVVPDVGGTVSIWYVCADEPEWAYPDVAGPFDRQQDAEEAARRMATYLRLPFDVRVDAGAVC